MSAPPSLGAAAASVLGTEVFPLDVAREPEVFLVSDLHLRPDQPAPNAAFAELVDLVPDEGLLLVLGDLFDYWVGRPQLLARGWRSIVDILRGACERGVRVYTLWGNRDFQLDAGFERATGCRVVGGALLLEGGGRPLLCLHGDELCQNDRPYQKAKRRLRSLPVRVFLHHAPFFVSRRLADGARNISRKSVAAAAPETMRPSAIAMAALRELGDIDVLFGHVHVAATGTLPGDGAAQRYWVLPAFEADTRGHARWSPGRQPRLFERGAVSAWPGPLPLGK